MEQLAEAEVDDLVSVQAFSALKKSGLSELKQVMNAWYLGNRDTEAVADDPSELIEK